MIFEFRDSRDFVRATRPNQELPDDDFEHIRQNNAGAYLNNNELSVRDIGRIGAAVIVLNQEAIENSYQRERQRGTALGYADFHHDIVVHEQQHADNHLYLRPFATGELRHQAAGLLEQFHKELEKVSQQIRDIVMKEANRQQINLEDFKVESYQSNQLIDRLPSADRAIIKQSLAEIVGLFETTETTVIELLDRENIEMIVKEELLAFATSTTEHTQLSRHLSPYLEQIVEMLSDARTMFTELYLYLPKRLWEEVGFEFRPPHPFAILIGGAELAQKSDAFARRFAHLDGQVQAVIDFYIEQTQLGAALLEKAETEGMREQFLPLLISQPLERWPRLLDEALRRSEVTRQGQNNASATLKKKEEHG